MIVKAGNFEFKVIEENWGLDLKKYVSASTDFVLKIINSWRIIFQILKK